MAEKFSVASKITQVDSHTYSANFPQEWCVGTVLNGGFVTSCFMRVASLHFSTTLSKQNQPHTIALHLEFLRRTQIGAAEFTVKEKKLGRQASVIHITLRQDGRDEAEVYITQSNLATESGKSYETDWALRPAPAPADTSKFADGGCANWGTPEGLPFTKFRHSWERLRWFFPRRGQRSKSISDEWLSFSSGENFPQEALGFVCDNFPLVIESYLKDRPYDLDHLTDDHLKNNPMGQAANFWYPTLLLNLDIKKLLPPEGAKYLFVRAESKQIRNGRLDLEITIMDEQGDLVALSHHIVLVVSAERNLAKRSKGGSGKL